jgi:hypothetical protein
MIFHFLPRHKVSTDSNFYYLFTLNMSDFFFYQFCFLFTLFSENPENDFFSVQFNGKMISKSSGNSLINFLPKIIFRKSVHIRSKILLFAIIFTWKTLNNKYFFPTIQLALIISTFHIGNPRTSTL